MHVNLYGKIIMSTGVGSFVGAFWSLSEAFLSTNYMLFP